MKKVPWSSTHSGHCQHAYLPTPAGFLEHGPCLLSNLDTKVMVKATEKHDASFLVPPQHSLDEHSDCPGTARMWAIFTQ